MDYKRIELSLGTIVKIVSERNDWLYVQTTYGREGYVKRKTCLPFKAPSLRNRTTKLSIQDSAVADSSFQKWENHNAKNEINLSERNIDILYLKATGIFRRNIEHKSRKLVMSASEPIVLIVKYDFVCKSQQTLAVKRGDTVLLIHNHFKGWFWVKNLCAQEGFIPTAVAAYQFC